MSDVPVRPATFASIDIRVFRVGDGVARLSIGGLTVHLSEQEARALCTALRDALDVTPSVETKMGR